MRPNGAIAFFTNTAEKIGIVPVSNEQRLIVDIVNNIETVMIGKRAVVELVVLCLISNGHVLIEDVPGVGKTSLVSALAQSVNCDFKRIQFTPDTMPSDITGFSMFNQKKSEFEFRPGSAFSNVVLADEINRASAKTQASLLEVMEERQITVDLHTMKMKEPYMVLATQNPLEYLGTYPLPEAQIDRFMIKISIGYPSLEEEMRVVTLGKNAKANLQPVCSAQNILDLRRAAEEVTVKPALVQYMAQIVRATRQHPDVLLGASPRGCIALYQICRAFALYQGRGYVIPDDIKFLVPYVLNHRITLKHDAKINHKTPDMVVKEILNSTAVPVVNLE